MIAARGLPVLVALLVGCDRAPPVPRDEPPPAPAAAARAAPVPPASAFLPAGLYFRDGHYERGACPACEEPRWAVALGPFATGEDATAALELVDRAALPPGYPWGVHTDDLALDDAGPRGVLVVLGLFADPAPASTLARAAAGARTWPLASRAEALRRLHQVLGDDARIARAPRVVQIDDGAGAPGYRADEVRALVDALAQRVHPSLQALLDQTEARVAALAPRCHVPARSLHLIVGHEHDLPGQGFEPARCPDGEVVYVRGAQTRVRAVVSSFGRAGYRIVQPVVIECDVPSFGEWRYDRAGRVPIEPYAARRVEPGGGC